MNQLLQSIKQRFGIIGNSKLLDNALDTAVRVANTDLSVLITGESGVGKEVFSKVIHSLSPRKHNQFIAVNCGAIPEGTINSELFGHEKGSFTGATGERKGYFETVDGGTIFLDEIGETPLETQAFLLRVLETGEFLRVGSSKTLSTNVRVIAATNIDLAENVRRGKFREDLYYRLNTVPIRVPSLKERPEDIYMLFRKFAIDFAEKYRTTPIQLDDSAQNLLRMYSWPGNIRELKNVAEQLSVLTENRSVSSEELIHLIPNIVNRNLPALSGKNGGDFQEREILYKLLFDMKSDLNDLKKLVFELISTNNLSVNMSSLRQLQPVSSSSYSNVLSGDQPDHDAGSFIYDFQNRNNPDQEDYNQLAKPIIIDKGAQPHFDKMDVVEESLSIEDMEKDLIQKALKKHAGRRKEAADDLGISERTLYRKIKQYDLQ